MVSSRTASAPPQKKCKKKGLPHYLMRQPLTIGSVLGNRTPDSAVRGLRLNLLTNTPYSLIIYAVQRKIYYTEEPPSCPVLFLFFSKLFLKPAPVTGVSAGRSLRTKTEFSGFAGRHTQTGTGAPAWFALDSPLSL